jgi:hypothetical protein
MAALQERIEKFIDDLPGNGTLYDFAQTEAGDLRLLIDYGIGGIKLKVLAEVDLPEIETPAEKPTSPPKKPTRKRATKTE